MLLNVKQHKAALKNVENKLKYYIAYARQVKATPSLMIVEIKNKIVYLEIKRAEYQ